MVYLPQPLTARLYCTNGTKGFLRLNGHSLVELDSGCQCELRKHLLTSDFSLRMIAPMDHYVWDYNPLLHLDGVTSEQLVMAYREHQDEHQSGQLLDQLMDHIRNNQAHLPSWGDQYAPGLSISSLLLGLSITLGIIGVLYFVFRRRDKLRKYWTAYANTFHMTDAPTPRSDHPLHQGRKAYPDLD